MNILEGAGTVLKRVKGDGKRFKAAFKGSFKKSDLPINIEGTDQTGENVVLDQAGGNKAVEESVPDQTFSVVSSATLAEWKSLNTFARVVGPEFGPIKEMAELFMECEYGIQLTGEAMTEYDALRVLFEGLFENLQTNFGVGCPLTMTGGIESLCRSILVELEHLKKLQDRSMGERPVVATDQAGLILVCYRRIEGHLQRLLLNSNPPLWRFMQEHSSSGHASAGILRLSPSLSACHNSAEAGLMRRGCTPGTRTDVLANILGWARADGGGGVYWLNGMAGTGKTTIAYSVCNELDTLHKLGASFFCSRLREKCRDVNLIIPSIAYQLAQFSLPFQAVLSAALKEDPEVHHKVLHIQFDEMIVKPLLEVEQTLPENLVIVIDALDECENKESIRHMLDLLLSKAATLPIRFIVSSRPEPEIRDKMDERAKSGLVLHELDKGKVQADIETYLRVELAPLRLEEAQISELVAKAGVLFIYAATTVWYIGYDNFQSDPLDRLYDVLDMSRAPGTSKNEKIDQLYWTILEAALGKRELRASERENMQQVLHAVICAREPLTVRGLSELLGINKVERVRVALRPF
ncbi:unnamed protein product [Rhizoctonia solani]|uniref:NACHT domain-containing protein n=1 Tax=Rhizoctonia solani TaxID=456999 RepID=A0A8H3H1B7_9AGAM|nr:unnamed protein product [Rhizoctonia solani]